MKAKTKPYHLKNPISIWVSRGVEWLEHWDCDQHGLSSKPTQAILCVLGKNFMALSPAWWSWQAVLNFSHISIKFQADSNILASWEVGQGNCLLYV